MILAIHVAIALASLIYAGYVFFRPSDRKLKTSYSFVALTVLSGFYLVWSQPAHMMQACVSGLIYLGVVFVAIALTQLKLAALKSD